MLNNDVEAEHLGSGVVLFRSAIDVDWDYVRAFSKNAINGEKDDMYTPAVDPATGKDVYLNKSGYFFGKEDIDAMPKRGSAIHRYDDKKIKEIFDFIEKSKDRYLLKYFELFPLSFKCVWWKVKGHIVQYQKNVYLGSHSDVSADYVYGVWTPTDQLATRNTISNVFYLSSCVDNIEQLDGSNFVGGHHYFNYLDIDVKPNQGDLLMFPSNYMAAHEVRPVIAGERYSYLGWYSHGTPNEKVSENVIDPAKEPTLAETSTNLYMPTLLNDYREYILSRGFSKDSEQYRVTI